MFARSAISELFRSIICKQMAVYFPYDLTTGCTLPEVICADSSGCYNPTTQTCDGNNDCADMSDEAVPPAGTCK